VRVKTSKDVRIVNADTCGFVASLPFTHVYKKETHAPFRTRTHDSKACAEAKKKTSRAFFIVADLLWCEQIFYHLLRHPV
jgi:hypothetical protein